MVGRVEWVLAPLERAGVRYLVSRKDLVAMKKAAGRPRDLEDIAALSELAEEER